LPKRKEKGNMMTITIEMYGKKFAAEISEESSMDDIIPIIRGLLITAGFHENTIDEYIKPC
jgi:hypothetical protein